MKIQLYFLLLAGCLLGFASSCFAAIVSVPNASFETPNVAEGPGVTGPIPDWIFAVTNTGSLRVYDFTGASPSTVNGDQVIVINANAPGVSATSSLTSSASLLTIAAETTYKLTITASRGGGPNSATFALLAGSSNLGIQSIPANGPAWGFAWTDYSLSVTTGTAAADSRVGQPLKIQISVTAGSISSVEDGYDNVRLEATTVPEPSTAVFLGTAVSLFAVRRGRR